METKPDVIMGVDCSSKSFAFSIFVKGELAHYGEVKFGSGDIYTRMMHANQRLSAMIKEYPKIDAIYFESSVYIQNKKTVILLSYVLGAALSSIIDADTIVVPTPVISWQAAHNPALTKAEKEKIAKANPGRSKTWLADAARKEHKARGIEKVRETYGVTVPSDDVSDAILIGQFGVDQWQ